MVAYPYGLGVVAGIGRKDDIAGVDVCVGCRGFLVRLGFVPWWFSIRAVVWDGIRLLSRTE